jgi:hypothetical protein
MSLGAKKTIAVVIVVLLLFIVLLSSLHHQSGYSVSNVTSETANFGATAPYGANSIIYSDGNAFIEYNFFTNQSTPLTANVGLSQGQLDNIQVSPNHTYILFHDQVATPNGVLYTQLQASGLNPTLGYWWLYNTNTRSFAPLPQGILLAKLKNSTNIFALSAGSTGEQMTEYSIPSLAKQTSFNIPGSMNFYPTQSGLLLQTPDNTILSTTNGVVNTQLDNNASIVGIDSDNQAVVISGGQSNRSLSVFNLTTLSKNLIASDVVDQPQLLSTGQVAYIVIDSKSGGSDLFTYDLKTNKQRQWNFNSVAANALGTNFSVNSLLSPTTAILFDGTHYFLVQASTK